MYIMHRFVCSWRYVSSVRSSLARLYGLQERGSRFYSQSEAEAVFKSTKLFVQRYTAIALNALRTVG